jgi:RNA polymerase sigma factor (TIGR02999 family)
LTIPRVRDTFYGTLAALGGSMLPTSAYPVTELLVRWRDGDLSAREALVPLVYDELRRIARRCLAARGADHTLQPTALVHEAYLRLVRRDSLKFQDRVHFFAMAAQMMRQILIDYARKAVAAKRGGNAVTVALDESNAASPSKIANLDLIALDDAMKQLATLDPRQSKIVELRFFGGLSIEEAAEAVEISPATAKREWATARVWLHRTMKIGLAS